MAPLRLSSGNPAPDPSAASPSSSTGSSRTFLVESEDEEPEIISVISRKRPFAYRSDSTPPPHRIKVEESDDVELMDAGPRDDEPQSDEPAEEGSSDSNSEDDEPVDDELEAVEPEAGETEEEPKNDKPLEEWSRWHPHPTKETILRLANSSELDNFPE